MKMDKDKWKALTGTIIFHGLLVLALMFLALQTPLPLPGEQGVEVSLGTTGAGLGNQAMQTSQKIMKPKLLPKPVSHPKPPAPKPQPKPAITEQKNLTQNTEKAPALEKKKVPEKKKIVKPTKKKPGKKVTKELVKEMKDTTNISKKAPPQEKPQPVVNQRALFKLAPGSQNRSRGIKSGTGDQGKPHGFKESNEYNGRGGKGRGISFSLGNRGAMFLDKPSASFTEQGTVVVRIEVNPQGKVTNARVFAKGTTVVSENLRQLAVRAAENSLFSTDPTAPGIQIGTITYHFILKR
jgi:TonB family protein